MSEKPYTTADEMLAVEAYRSAPCPVCERKERCRCRVPAEKAHYRILAVLDALVAAGWQPPTVAIDGAKDQTKPVQELVAALADCVVKAVEHGEQDGGFVAFYLLPTGPIHRAIALLQERHGITVRPGFDGREGWLR